MAGKKVPLCAHCNKQIRDKHYLVCSVCKQAYDLPCVKREKLFYLMDKDRRSSWVCDKCSQTTKLHSKSSLLKQKKVSPATSVCNKKENTPVHRKENEPVVKEAVQHCNTETENVTVRKYAIPTQNSFESLSEPDELNSSDYEDTMNTYEALNTSIERLSRSVEMSGSACNIENLQEIINNLTLDLGSTQKELENTICENNCLKRRVMKLTQEIEILKTICKTPSPLKTSSLCTPRRKKRQSLNPTQFTNTFDNSEENQKLEKIILDLQQQLDKSNTEIELLKTLAQKLTECPETRRKIEIQKQEKNSNLKDNIIPTQQKTKQTRRYASNFVPEQQNSIIKHKICIVSSNAQNKISQISKNIFSDYEICHYIKTGVGILELIDNIDNKLKEFTLNDYCVLFVGDKDFKISQDYHLLIDKIRTILEKIDYTNFIICVPTYKICMYRDLYNARIELFNNLLLNDVNKYEYAYILDSNLNLTSDRYMFQRNGLLNDRGMRCIIRDLQNLLEEINGYFDESLNFASNSINDSKKTPDDPFL